jgi:hypothetical protein
MSEYCASQQEVRLALTSDQKSSSSLLQQAWPVAILILGAGITVAWTALLGYGTFVLAQMAL